MPVFVPLLYVGVVAVGAIYIAKTTDGKLEQISKETYDLAVEQGVPILESIGEEIKAGLIAVGGTVGAALQAGLIDLAEALEELGPDILSGLESLGAGIANATLEVLEYAGPKIVDGIDNTYDYIRAKIRGYEPDVITAVTVGLLAVLGGIYLWNAAKRGTMTYTE